MSVLNTLVDGYYTLTVDKGTEDEKQYRVKSLIDLQIETDFAKWHFERAIDDLAAARKLYTDAEYDIERNKIRTGFRQGLYDFKSKAGAELLNTMPAIAFICSKLIVGVEESKVLDLLAKAGEDAADILRTVLYDSFPDLPTPKKTTLSPARKKNKRTGRR